MSSDNDWYGWLHWMRNSFREGTIKENWKDIERMEWFGPWFRNFKNNDVIVIGVNTTSGDIYDVVVCNWFRTIR